MRLLIVALAVYLMTSAGGLAELAKIENGNDFKPSLKLVIRFGDAEQLSGEEADIMKQAFYYLRGYCDALRIEGVAVTNSPIKLPNGVSVIQVARILDKHLSDNPDKLHLPVSSLLYSALFEVFKRPASEAK